MKKLKEELDVIFERHMRLLKVECELIKKELELMRLMEEQDEARD